MTLQLGNRSLRWPVWTDGRIRLYIQDDLCAQAGVRFVATWAGEFAAIIDGAAFDIFRTVCGDDLQRLERYLQTIAEFEIRYSDSEVRHKARTPTELEILSVLRENGYFS